MVKIPLPCRYQFHNHTRTLATQNPQSTHCKQRDFSKPKERCYTISAQMADGLKLTQKENLHSMTLLPSCYILPSLIKVISILLFSFNT